MPAWLGWTVGYALAVWVIDTAHSLAGSWLNQASQRVQELAAVARFLIPLLVAFLIGVRLRAWWWILSRCGCRCANAHGRHCRRP